MSANAFYQDIGVRISQDDMYRNPSGWVVNPESGNREFRF
jgi:hypothetical protein